MADPDLSLDAITRLGFAVGLLVLFAIAEWLLPRRERSRTRRQRWPGNFGVQLVNIVLERLVPWVAPVAIAGWATDREFGLFNQLQWHVTLVFLVSLLALDLLIYWQHRLFHRIPLLWRLHRMHHTDVDLDVTSAFRFHPIEILASLLIKSSAVVLLGISVEAILVFAVVLNGMSLFNHANLGIPTALDRALRMVFVTPDMHRIHHSVEYDEHNRNFGFNLSCWDRLFGSYCSEPKSGQENMTLGLDKTNGQDTGSIPWMLRQPFQD